MKTKLYLICFTTHFNRDEIIKLIDNSGGFWFYNMDNTLFVKSELLATDLYKLIRTKFESEENTFESRIFITEVTSNCQGLLPQDHLLYFSHLFTNKTLK